MATFHPQVELLTEYASGSLSVAQAACVAAHLNYCEECGHSVTQLQNVGAALFESGDPVPVGDTILNRVLSRLDEEVPLHYCQYVRAVREQRHARTASASYAG